MISEADRDKIAQAIHEAEKGTAGEIVCVLARASSEYSYAGAMWAAFIALVAPWIALYVVDWSVMRILSLQVIVFVIAALLLSQGPILRLLTPRAVQRRRAHRAAMEQFFIRGLASTPNRMGVMIFVSMAERYARIIADEGIARLVPHEEWQDIVDALIAQAKAGRIADGFVEAVARTGDKLSKHAPPDGTGDALPNRIYVI